MGGRTEKEVNSLVGEQIDESQEEKPGTISERIEEEKYVKTKPGNPGATRNRFPFSEFVFEEDHWPKRSKCASAEKGSSDNVFRYQSAVRTSANTTRHSFLAAPHAASLNAATCRRQLTPRTLLRGAARIH